MAVSDFVRWAVENRRPVALADQLERFGPAAACWPEYETWAADQREVPAEPVDDDSED